jgi:hypothetical protein
MSIAEWVRQALASARRVGPTSEVGKKLEIIRAAARHKYPVSDIDEMLAEIGMDFSGQNWTSNSKTK